MVPSKQLALTLVASAATKDPSRELPSSAIATENQVECTKSTSTDKSIVSSSSAAFKYSPPHLSATPAQAPVHSSDEPALTRIPEESRSPPAASTNPLKIDAALSAAAGPPGNPRGSDGPTRNARDSESGTRGLRTASLHGVTLGGTTASMLGEILAQGTSRSEENLWGRDCSGLLGTANALGEALGRGTSASVLGETLGSDTPSSEGNPRRIEGPSGDRAPVRGTVLEEPRFPSRSFFLEQRPDQSSFRQSSRHSAPTKLSPSSARHVSHLGGASPHFPSFPHVPSYDSPPASRADLVRADPLKTKEGYSLERSSQIGRRSLIEGDVQAGRVGGQDATPEPVSVEHDFAGGEPEPVKENFAGGEPEPVKENFAGGEPELSAEAFRDVLAEQGTAGGHEHQVKIDQFQAFISGLSMAERFRVLGVPEVHAVRPPVKTPSIRSAVELSQENPGPGALPRRKFRSAARGRAFNVASRKFSNLDPVKFHAPPVMTREE